MMVIQIIGRDYEGNPHVILKVGGGYNPDILDDLTARAIAMYAELFPVINIDAPIEYEPTEGAE